jgi:WD40-like Beta Propeller Repeat
MTRRSLIFLTLFFLSQCHPDKRPGICLRYRSDNVELFAENIVSTNLYERDIAISSAGDEIIFTLGDYKQSKRCLVSIKKRAGEWGDKEILGFSGRYNDIEPFFSPDGDKLYFSSDRPLEADSSKRNYNIWVSARTGRGWGEPEPLPSNINTNNDEFFPSVSKNGNLYFTSVRGNGVGHEDIFLSRFAEGVYSDPQPLDTNINTSFWEFNAYVDPEETLIIFSSYGRADDMGEGDLYYSRKDSCGAWMPAVNFGPPINSDKLDYSPFMDIPRANLYFTSERMRSVAGRIKNVQEVEAIAGNILNGMGNIYRVHFDKFNPR